MDDVRTEEASALLDFLAGGEPKPADMPSIRAMMGALHRRAEAAEQRADSVEAALAAASPSGLCHTEQWWELLFLPPRLLLAAPAKETA